MDHITESISEWSSVTLKHFFSLFDRKKGSLFFSFLFIQMITKQSIFFISLYLNFCSELSVCVLWPISTDFDYFLWIHMLRISKLSDLFLISYFTFVYSLSKLCIDLSVNLCLLVILPLLTNFFSSRYRINIYTFFNDVRRMFAFNILIWLSFILVCVVRLRILFVHSK